MYNSVMGTMNPAENAQDEAMTDRALVAFYTGYAHNAHGNGVGYTGAWLRLDTLERRGWVKVQKRNPGATPTVWLTEEGHEVVNDIDAEGSYNVHVEALRAAA